jgi:hypothetical protein
VKALRSIVVCLTLLCTQPVQAEASTLDTQNAAARTAGAAAESLAFKAHPKFYQRCATPISLTLRLGNIGVDAEEIDFCNDLETWTNLPTNLGAHYTNVQARRAQHNVDFTIRLPNGDVYQAKALRVDETAFPEPNAACHTLRSTQNAAVITACVRLLRVGPALEITAFERPASEVARSAAMALGWRVGGVELLGKGGRASYNFKAMQPPQALFFMLADAAKCDCEVNFPAPDHVVFSRPPNRARIIALRQQIEAAKTPADAAQLRQIVLLDDNALYQGFDRSDLWLAQAQWALRAKKHESRHTGDTADESRHTGDTADESRHTGDTADESRHTGDTADESRRTGDTADESRRTGDTADESRRTGDTADESRRTGDTADESRRTGDTADESGKSVSKQLDIALHFALKAAEEQKRLNAGVVVTEIDHLLADIYIAQGNLGAAATRLDEADAVLLRAHGEDSDHSLKLVTQRLKLLVAARRYEPAGALLHAMIARDMLIKNDPARVAAANFLIKSMDLKRVLASQRTQDFNAAELATTLVRNAEFQDVGLLLELQLIDYQLHQQDLLSRAVLEKDAKLVALLTPSVAYVASVLSKLGR